MRWLKTAAAVLVAGGLVVAAPMQKPKEEKPPEATAEHFEKSTNNLKEIGIAWHNYNDTNGFFPANQCDGEGKSLLSWRVQILPYIEQDELYKQFRMNEPWDSEHNKKLIPKMPAVFKPVRVKAPEGMTFYQTFTGKNAIMLPGARRTLATIADGTSNTFMLTEGAKAVVWTKPDDLAFDGKEVPKLGGHFDGRFLVVMADGSVRRVRQGVDSKLLAMYIDPADGQVGNDEALEDKED